MAEVLTFPHAANMKLIRIVPDPASGLQVIWFRNRDFFHTFDEAMRRARQLQNQLTRQGRMEISVEVEDF